MEWSTLKAIESSGVKTERFKCLKGLSNHVKVHELKVKFSHYVKLVSYLSFCSRTLPICRSFMACNF
jgi:pantothenate kinase